VAKPFRAAATSHGGCATEEENELVMALEQKDLPAL
jgi:hypothetical protein